MKHFRIIPRLDLKNDTVIKGIHLEGLRVMGDPVTYARKYARDGADELLCMDAVASLYGRPPQPAVIARIAAELDIPLTAGGGIRSVEDAQTMLLAGADKIAVNTAAVRRPALIGELAAAYGSQCVVLSVEARRTADNTWEIYTDAGREKTGIDALAWIKHACALGAGEIVLTSVDREGTLGGYDLNFIRAVASFAEVPVIAHGGADGADAMRDAWQAGADAGAAGSIFHYNRCTLQDIRQQLAADGVPVSALRP